MRLGVPIIIVLTAMIRLPAIGQCAADLTTTTLVTDRYLDADVRQGHLILANGHGLVIKDMATPNLTTLGVVTVPGDVTSIALHGDELFAVARDMGVFIFRFREPVILPEQRAFVAVDGARSVSVVDNLLFVASADALHLIEVFDDYSFRLLDAQDLVSPLKKVAANQTLAFGHMENGGIVKIAYDRRAFTDSFSTVVVDAEDEFYDMALNDDVLIIDTRSGIKWIRYTPQGDADAHGAYLDNQGSQVVLGMALGGDHLYVRYATRFDVFRIMPDETLMQEASTQLDLSEIRIPKMFGFEDRLILLNVNSNSRTWSLADYQISSDLLMQRAILPSRIEQVNGVGSLDNRIFFGIGDTVYYQDIVDGASIEDLDSMHAFTLPNPILELIDAPENLVLTTSDPDSGESLLMVFETDDLGQLVQIAQDHFVGSVGDLRETNGWVSFLQYYRDAESDRFTIHLRNIAEQSGPSAQIERDLPIGSPVPFRDIFVWSSTLYYHDGQFVFSQDVSGADGPFQLPAPWAPNEIQSMAVGHGLIWIETEEGLRVYRDLGVRLLEVGVYPNWRGLTATKNGSILAQNRVHQVPGLNTMLLPDADGLVVPQLDLLASSPPGHVSFIEDQLLVSETSSVNLYDVVCPPLDYVYLLPFDPQYRLEVNTDLDRATIIQVTIFDSNNRVIGLQMLSSDTLPLVNGQVLSAWFVDYNTQYEPHSLMVRCNDPLAPILSGTASGYSFAYQVPPAQAGAITLPHVPKLDNGWFTDLHLRVFDFQDSVRVYATAPDNRVSLLDLEPPNTRIMDVGSLFEPPTPWFELSPEYLETSLSGFTLFSQPFWEYAAALPLVYEPSEILLVPHLIGLPETWWTGLALTNPQSHSVRLRVVGYDRQGEISVNRETDIPAKSQFVAKAENWLHIILNDIDVQWLTLVAEAPIYGIVLYGSQANALLGGMPLTDRSSTSLDFSGIQSTTDRWTSVIITNRESLAGNLTFTAIGDQGQVLATANAIIAEKGKLILRITDLFELDPGFGDADIKTIRVTGDRDLIGLVFRGDRAEESLEVYPALIR